MDIKLAEECFYCGSDRIKLTGEYIDEEIMELVHVYKCSKCGKMFIYGIDIREVIERIGRCQ